MTVRWGMLSTAAIGRVVAGAIRGSKQAEFAAAAVGATVTLAAPTLAAPPRPYRPPAGKGT